MRVIASLLLGTALAGSWLLCGCKKKASAKSDAPSASQPVAREPSTAVSAEYFHTPFQNEAEYVVTAIVSDVAEQITFAASRTYPRDTNFVMVAREKVGLGLDQPVFEIRGRLGAKETEIKSGLTVSGSIWSPQVYAKLAEEFAETAELSGTRLGSPEDVTWLARLHDGTPETIEKENQQLSAALEKDFTDPELHERAAILLTVFMLRDHSGKFFDLRAPLCRATSHLVIAQLLRRSDKFGLNGQLAGAALLALVNNGAAARDQLKTIKSTDPAVPAFVRALQARATGDYRPLLKSKLRTPLETAECFAATARYLGSTAAWTKFPTEQRTNITLVRIAHEFPYSVSLGHELLDRSLAFETEEMKTVFELWHNEKLPSTGWLGKFNEPPERSFILPTGGTTAVRVIGWGQWANLMQRHLCQAVQENFHFMHDKWGVPEGARQFADKCEKQFGELWMYAFVRRFVCSDAEAYHKAVDDGLALTIATPHLVPAECWNFLCYKPDFTERYAPNPNPHVNEWHFHNPLPGTIYDLGPRLDHPSLVNRMDALNKFQHLHQMNPFDERIIEWLIEHKYEDAPTFQEITDLYLPILGYSRDALTQSAKRIADRPQEYERLLLQAAELDPASYYDLADYLAQIGLRDKAASYYDKACAADPDAVRIANYASWRIQYYLSRKQVNKAREIAEQAGEVYSFHGLAAKAGFFESTANYDDAFDWYRRIEERYHDSGPLLNFCTRYKARTHSDKFASEVEVRARKLFPLGEELVTLRDFRGAPQDGVLVNGENDLSKAAGLKEGDVIVAAYGRRAHNLDQYVYLRDSKDTPELELIVWQGNSYRLIKASPPEHRFGVDFRDYSRN